MSVLFRLPLRSTWTLTLLASLCISSIPFLTRLGLLLGVPANTLLNGRMALALIGFILHALLYRLPLTAHTLRWGSGIGIVVGIGEWAFLQGVSQTGAALASVFLGLTPIAVFVVYQVWQRAARPARHWVRLMLGVGGSILLMFPTSAVGWSEGSVWLMVAVCCFAAQMILTQMAGDVDQRLLGLAITGAAWIVITLVDFPALTVLPSLALSQWLIVLGLALFGTYLARLTLIAAIQHGGALEFALLSPMQIVFGVGWAWWLLGERLTGWQLAGAGAVMLCLLLAL